MSTPEEPTGGAPGGRDDDIRRGELDRDDLEGSYTDADDEVPHERAVHGQYTETEDFPGPETVTEGSYTDEEEPADAPQGQYTESDFTEDET